MVYFGFQYFWSFGETITEIIIVKLYAIIFIILYVIICNLFNNDRISLLVDSYIIRL